MNAAKRWAVRLIPFAIATAGLSACEPASGSSGPQDQLMAPGVDLAAAAKQDSSDAVEAGHRLIAAGEYELALRSFNRAALRRGTLDAEILSGLGTANLGLGRLGQAETLLRRAVLEDAAEPVDYNNLGVLLMEQGKTSEALQYFRRAFALSNGENIAIRDNLRLVLAKTENAATVGSEKSSDYKLVRRGNSDFIIRATP